MKTRKNLQFEGSQKQEQVREEAWMKPSQCTKSDYLATLSATKLIFQKQNLNLHFVHQSFFVFAIKILAIQCNWTWSTVINLMALRQSASNITFLSLAQLINWQASRIACVSATMESVQRCSLEKAWMIDPLWFLIT